MTQFALVKVGPDLSEKAQQHLMPCPSEGLMRDASRHIFKDPSNVFLLAPYGRPFDEAYLSAQRMVSEGGASGDTDLFLALNDLNLDAKAVALWYGNDFLNLPSVPSWEELLSALQQDLEEPALETYMVLSTI